ncbi:hypothetical protein DERF_008185 [Dermatophagoides farinae]|uniref:Uncharacterized protein n=1 Tax=Dermatophagoides farinae TaxID=6954 RepID=A0A922L8X0_DERFA|nr:hypothetical protein DERF_008185 [Dermatophagoides farinae]
MLSHERATYVIRLSDDLDDRAPSNNIGAGKKTTGIATVQDRMGPLWGYYMINYPYQLCQDVHCPSIRGRCHNDVLLQFSCIFNVIVNDIMQMPMLGVKKSSSRFGGNKN